MYIYIYIYIYNYTISLSIHLSEIYVYTVFQESQDHHQEALLRLTGAESLVQFSDAQVGLNKGAGQFMYKWGFRVLRFRVLGFRGLGFRGFRIWGLGFPVRAWTRAHA